MSSVTIPLVLLVMVVAGEATVLPLIKALFGKDGYNNLETSNYYTQDGCIYPNGYYSYNGYPTGGYYGYNGYDRYYTGYNYPRGYYTGYNGYPRGYNAHHGYYPRGYNGYDYPRADTPRQGKTWSELCKVHYPDSSGAPGYAGVVCL